MLPRAALGEAAEMPEGGLELPLAGGPPLAYAIKLPVRMVKYCLSVNTLKRV